ncbi:hypothetical protein QBC41DRAFT_216216 [Cercophora samala]|uniref:Uncharacterized protein n=1 Tax=Cercophora samala TaxID=330535 RepID=A0AA40DGN6_9PEZI|nr:hypothetical protein QBC41DRAFT_216216 [Cercophora samala]
MLWGVTKGQFPYQWCQGCGVVRSKTYHILVKSGAPIAPDNRLCGQCIDHREARRRIRKTSREGLIVESLDRKVQTQDVLREEIREGYRLAEPPAKVDEKRGLVYKQPREITTSATRPVNTHPKELKNKELSSSEIDGLVPNDEGIQPHISPHEEQGHPRQNRARVLQRRRPRNISKLHWAALNASPLCRNEVERNPGGGRYDSGGASLSTSSEGDSLSNLSMAPMHLAATDRPSQQNYQENTPQTPNPTYYQSSPDDNASLPSPPKRQRSSLYSSPPFSPSSTDDVFSANSATAATQDSRSSKIVAPVSTSPSASPITKGLAGLFFSQNPGAESRMNNALGLTPSPPQRVSRRRNRGRAVLPTSSESSSDYTKYRPAIKSPLSKYPPVTAESFAPEMSLAQVAAPVGYPGNGKNHGNNNNRSTPKRKRSEQRFLYSRDDSVEETEEEEFIPDPVKLAEAQERMMKNGEWAVNGDGSPPQRRKLPQDGIVRRMSELDAMFAEDGDRAVEVGSELAWKIEG